MKKPNVDGTKALQIVALVLSLGGTIISSIVNEKKTKETLSKLVDEKLGQK